MNTIIEKIRAEIEQMLHSIENCPFIEAEFGAQEKRDGKLIAYKDLLSFLSDLEKEEEKPMELDFEQELYKHFGQVKDFTLGMRIGQYFYELGRQSKRNIEICPHSIKSKSYAMNKPKPSEVLEEEIQKYMSERWEFGCINPTTPVYLYDFTTDELKECARHFAKWGEEHAREQMMKEARPRFIHNVLDDNTIRKMVHLYSEEIPKEKNVVKLIIIKED